MESLETKINHFFTELLATHDSIQVTHAVINDLVHRRVIGLDAFVTALHYMCVEGEVSENGWALDSGWTSADNTLHMAVIVVHNHGNIEHCLGKWLERKHGVIVIEPECDNDDGITKAKNYLDDNGIQVLPKEWTKEATEKLFNYLDLNGDIKDEILDKEFHFEIDFPIDLKIPSPIKAKSKEDAEKILNLQIGQQLIGLNKVLWGNGWSEIDAWRVNVIWK